MLWSLFFFLFSCVCAQVKYEPILRVSLVSGDVCLTHLNGQVSFNPITQTNKYLALWDLRDMGRGIYRLTPSDDPLRVVRGGKEGISIADINESRGQDWRIRQRMNESGLYFESVSYPGWYLSMDKRQVVMVNVTEKAAGFTMAEELMWRPDESLLVANFDRFMNVPLVFEEMNLVFGDVKVNQFVMERDNSVYQGYTYRLKAAQVEDVYVSLTPKNGLELQEMVESEKTDEEIYDDVRISTFAVLVYAVELDSATIMLESMLYPGRFVMKGSDLKVGSVTQKTLTNALWKVKLDATKLDYAWTTNLEPVIASLSMSSRSELALLKHKQSQSILKKLSDPVTMGLYDSTWKIEHTALPSVVYLKSINYPTMYLGLDKKKQPALMYSKSTSGWMMRPINEATGGARFESMQQPGRFLSLDMTTGYPLLSDKGEALHVRDAVAPVFDQPLVPFAMGSWMEKSIRLRNVDSNELLQINGTLPNGKIPAWRFVIRPGLNKQAGYCSFESAAMPGYFLKHDMFGLSLKTQDKTKAWFTQEASWRVYHALSVGEVPSVSVESANYPGMFVSMDAKMVGVKENERALSFVLEVDEEVTMAREAGWRRARRNVPWNDEL